MEPLRSTFAASERRRRRPTGTAGAVIAGIAIEIEVRDLIEEVCAPLGPAAVPPSTTLMRPIVARPLPSESATTGNRAWRRACCPIVDLTTRPGTVTVTKIACQGTASASEIESEIEIVIMNAALVGTMSSITMIERDALERRTGRGSIAGEWTATSANFPMVMRDLVHLVVAGLTTTRSIAEIRGMQR